MIKWSNQSVLAFAQGQDPIKQIEEKAKEIVYTAMQEGWQGPPYDPLKLADILNIPVTARSDIQDARTVALEKGLLIEFNPNRPRGRIRYSLAHEIAHSLFPDCADKIRNRAVHAEQLADEWQLELLCNIAAAELIMPAGTLNDLRDEEIGIEHILELRKKYDVSMEAMLLRMGRITSSPCAIFCASPIQSTSAEKKYRLDYVFSNFGDYQGLKSGDIIPDNSAIYECAAIGHTAKSRDTETWSDIDDLLVQCVGLPPYPGSLLPRIAGILRFKNSADDQRPSIEYLRGNALKPRGEDKRIIAHIVNDKTPNWGGRSFASNLARQFPDVQEDFKHWSKDFPEYFSLGNIHVKNVTTDLAVISMIAQHGFGASATPRLRYPALESCLVQLSEIAQKLNASIHMPRIGAGNAGGKWEVIEEYILTFLSNNGIEVTVYDLPQSRTELPQTQDSLFNLAM